MVPQQSLSSSTATSPKGARTFNMEMAVDGYQVRDVLKGTLAQINFVKAILNTILFHRLLTPQSPKQEYIEDLEISYLRNADDRLAMDIDAACKAFKSIFDSGTHAQVIAIQFYELRRSERRSLWQALSNSNDERNNNGSAQEAIWEQWQVKVCPLMPGTSKEATKRRLRDCLAQISIKSIEGVDLLPAIGSRPYMFRIVQPSTASESWSRILRKMLSETAVPSLLE